MKTHLFFTALLACWIAPALGQVKGNASYERQMNNVKDNPRGLMQQQATNSWAGRFDPHSTQADFANDSAFVIEANTLMNVLANEYVAYLTITQVGSTLDSAYARMDERIAATVTALSTLAGIPKEKTYVDFISLVPTFEFEVEKKLFSKNASEIPTGYELSKTIHIPYQRSGQLDLIMMAAAKGEIYDLVKVDYIVSDIQAIYDTLRTVAVDLINQKREAYEKMGFTFDQAKWAILADDVVSTYPTERYKSYSAFSSSALGYDKFKKVEKVKKNQSYYYDKINYNDFDLVINPTVVEPAVQFLYTLKVMFTLHPTEAKSGQ
jgi:uncharacterized protein YggE